MNPHRKKLVLLLGALCFSQAVNSSGFRCGTHLVVVGDSVGRLMRSCGKPSLKYKAKELLRKNSSSQPSAVMHWVYERGRRKSMVVSVRSGKVVKIALE